MSSMETTVDTACVELPFSPLLAYTSWTFSETSDEGILNGSGRVRISWRDTWQTPKNCGTQTSHSHGGAALLSWQLCRPQFQQRWLVDETIRAVLCKQLWNYLYELKIHINNYLIWTRLNVCNCDVTQWVHMKKKCLAGIYLKCCSNICDYNVKLCYSSKTLWKHLKKRRGRGKRVNKEFKNMFWQLR